MTILLNFLFLCFSSCSEEKPEASFDYEFIGDCSSPTLTVQFRNLSQSASIFMWDFGDETTSTEFSPNKVYSKADTYQVTLTASSNAGNSTYAQYVTIYRNSDGAGPNVSFQVSQSVSNVTFTNLSTGGELYVWNFGDGTILETEEEEQSIDHQYSGPGSYSVLLTASSNEGSNCFSLTVTVSP